MISKSNNKKILHDLSLQELQEDVVFLNLPKYRAIQLFEMGTKYLSWQETTNLPQDLKNKLANVYVEQALDVESIYEGYQGTQKYLLKTVDNELIESVYIPNKHGGTVCVSTQIGCKMNCSFCASGKDGWGRNLSAGEIIAQVLFTNKLKLNNLKRGISNIVLMGSGEPLDNFDNVIKFINIITSKESLNVSKRNITLSTCGLIDKIISLADMKIGINLAISLHASNDIDRQKIMPVAKNNPISALIDAGNYYFEKTGRRVSYEYALSSDSNTSSKSAHELANLLKGSKSHVNLIPINPILEVRLPKINQVAINEFKNILTENGINVTIRKSVGAEIEGACGQLKRRYLNR